MTWKWKRKPAPRAYWFLLSLRSISKWLIVFISLKVSHVRPEALTRVQRSVRCSGATMLPGLEEGCTPSISQLCSSLMFKEQTLCIQPVFDCVLRVSQSAAAVRREMKILRTWLCDQYRAPRVNWDTTEPRLFPGWWGSSICEAFRWTQNARDKEQVAGL